MKATITVPGGGLQVLTTCRAWLTNQKECVPAAACIAQQIFAPVALCPACDQYLRWLKGRWQSFPRPLSR